MRVSFAAAIAGLALAASAAAAPRYIAVPLGTPDAISVEGRAVNALGQVTGAVQFISGLQRAFLFTEGAMTLIEVGDAPNVQGNAINAVGDVAGCAWFVGSTRGFVYRGGVIELLPEKNGTNTVGCAVGISGDGHVVGEQYHDFQYSAAPSYRYFGGSIEDIPQTVASINNRGDLAGSAYAHAQPARAWAMIGGVYRSPLATFAGRESWATAINDRGQVVGSAGLGSQPFAYVYNEGEVTPIVGLEDSVSSSGGAINNIGDVVGVAWMADGVPRAFLYAAGTMHDLNALVVTGLEGATLTAAVGINDAGIIVANSCQPAPPYPQPCKAYRLDPLPDANNPANVPTLSHLALALLALLVAAFGVGVRRR